jgi:hypothetical protein
MSYIKGPIRLNSKEGGRLVWQKANSDQMKKDIKIVTGEGFNGKEGILKDGELIPTIKKFMNENKQLMIICWDREGQINRFLSIYSSKEKDIIKEAIERDALRLYFAPKRPKWHFTIIDGKHILIQQQHEENAASKRKGWLYCENDISDALKYNDYFDNWAKKCVHATVKKIFKEE